MMNQDLHTFFETIYEKYNKFKYIHPDPLEFLYKFDSEKDIEVVGLIASSFAYGRVNGIIKSLNTIFDIMDRKPYFYIVNTPEHKIKTDFNKFKHRFTNGFETAAFLSGLQVILRNYESLENLFYENFISDNILKSTDLFVKNILKASKLEKSSLLPTPSKGSACKRLYLFLRWMIRKDDVDPGLWSSIPKSVLLVPLDTHMHKTAVKLHFTSRKNGDFKTAVEITNHFAEYSPEDPVKYDFALTRFGINPNFDQKNLFKEIIDVLLN